MTDDGTINGGWLVLSENIYTSPIFHARPELFRLWILILCLARRSRTPSRLMDGRTIGYGEMITSLQSLRGHLSREGDTQRGEPADYAPSVSTVWRLLQTLESNGMISVDSSRKGATHITVHNYERYQTFDNYEASLMATANKLSEKQKDPTDTSTCPHSQQLELGSSDKGRKTSGKQAEISNYDTRDTRRGTDPAPDARKRPAQPDDNDLRFHYDTGNWNRQPTAAEIAIWKAAYPGIDLRAEMNRATLWLRDHKNRRKVRFGRFLANWFSKAQTRIDGRLS